MSNENLANKIKIINEQHFTQPPPRYSEVSLVKKLEELGIGDLLPMQASYQSYQLGIMKEPLIKKFIPTDRKINNAIFR